MKQETIAIIAVGLTILGTMLGATFRLEGRIESIEARIEHVQSETRAEARADREALRTEARADREAFSMQITRLIEQQGALSGLVEGLTIASSR